MKKIAPTVVAVCALIAPCSLAQATPSLETFQVPGATYTYPKAINSREEVTGSWKLSDQILHGFVRDRYGAITTFDIAGNQTDSIAINKKGEVVGGYDLGARRWRAFLRKPDGRIVTFRVPNEGPTSASGINANGEIIGTYWEPGSVCHHHCGTSAFLRGADGTFTEFAVPNSDTRPLGINVLGDVGGYAETYPAGAYGFIRTAAGQLTTFQIGGYHSTTVEGINDAGSVTGDVLTGNGSVGFVRTADGTVTTFSVPGCPYTWGMSINLNGVVAGRCTDSAGHGHGFIRATDGSISTLDVPGEDDTFVYSINDNGLVTGFGQNAANTQAVGFIYHS